MHRNVNIATRRRRSSAQKARQAGVSRFKINETRSGHIPEAFLAMRRRGEAHPQRRRNSSPSIQIKKAVRAGSRIISRLLCRVLSVTTGPPRIVIECSFPSATRAAVRSRSSASHRFSRSFARHPSRAAFALWDEPRARLRQYALTNTARWRDPFGRRLGCARARHGKAPRRRREGTSSGAGPLPFTTSLTVFLGYVGSSC